MKNSRTTGNEHHSRVITLITTLFAQGLLKFKYKPTVPSQKRSLVENQPLQPYNLYPHFDKEHPTYRVVDKHRLVDMRRHKIVISRPDTRCLLIRRHRPLFLQTEHRVDPVFPFMSREIPPVPTDMPILRRTLAILIVQLLFNEILSRVPQRNVIQLL